MGQILVGTSSWADPGFVKEWYPQGMPARERLSWYAKQFRYVELNSSFYAIPDRNTVRKWTEETPDDFVFDVKVHRALSRHAAQLDSLPPDLRDEATTNERGRVVLTPELEETLATPAGGGGRAARGQAGRVPRCSSRPRSRRAVTSSRSSRASCDALKPHRLAIELRHRGWVAEKRRDETLGWFSEHGVGLRLRRCAARRPLPDHAVGLDAVTDDAIAYMRVHGRNAAGLPHRQDGRRALRLAL